MATVYLSRISQTLGTIEVALSTTFDPRIQVLFDVSVVCCTGPLILASFWPPSFQSF